VEVRRYDIETGRLLWEHWCKNLGVGHSAYDHRAYMETVEGKVVICSYGSSGLFVEILEERSGKTLDRQEY
jgi:hypothetical protein